MAKKNKLPDIKGAQVLVPTNVSEIIGTRDDCFGKEYDLSTSECKRCGDSELCAVCFAQFMNKTRKQVEEENTFKDMESMVDPKLVAKYMRGLKRKGSEKKEVIHAAMGKFNLDKKTTRTIYKSLKK